MVADKIIMHAPKRLFHAWLQGTPYTSIRRMATCQSASNAAPTDDSDSTPADPSLAAGAVPDKLVTCTWKMVTKMLAGEMRQKVFWISCLNLSDSEELHLP